MKNFTDYITEELLLEKAGKAGSHLQHIEDLPFSTGDEGIEHAANILDDLDTMLSGKKKQSFNAPKAKSFVAGKFDGAPAIIFGIDPQTKRFFVASKSAFNVTPKINYTMEDIEKNHGSSPGLADKLRQALMYLPSVCPKKGIYQGDFMYDRWSIKKDDKFHEWTPNTITYRLKSNSAEGRKAFRAKFGIVVHTKYEGKTLGELQPTPYVDNENFGENPDVHLMPARVDMNPENWKPKDRADFTNALENAKILYGRMKPEAFDEVIKHSELLDLYFNEVVKGKTHTDVDEYVKFLTRQAEKEAGKLKTPARQEAVRRQFAELIKHVQVNKRHFKDAFTLRDHISKAKETLMGGLRQNTSDYEYYINGKKTGPEGYVVYRDGQDAVKLVDRKEFSKMNFELAKMKKPTFPVPSAPPIVMAFGRMNPPTGGHEGVINKVKEVAGQFGAAHEIVLSASEDSKKNPLTPEQKVKYAKKFFPGANITAATKDAPDFLTHAARVYAAGHRELIMVAGPDRIDNFRKTLAAYNGRAGKHGYYKFDHIKVVQSDRIPGKSGTEMRGYAANKDYDSFKAGLPSTATDTDVRNLYRDVKRAQQHKPVLRESYPSPLNARFAALVPAVQYGKKILRGKRGETHNDIYARHPEVDHTKMKTTDPNYPRDGSYDLRKRKFYDKEKSGIDSTDLMTKVQRMRYFGNEEYIQEKIEHKIKSAVGKVRDTESEFSPESDCAMIASAVHKTHGDKYHYYSIENEPTKKQPKGGLRHIYMHDPKRNIYFDGHGARSKESIHKRWMGGGEHGYYNKHATVKRIGGDSQYLHHSFYNYGDYPAGHKRHADLMTHLSEEKLVASHNDEFEKVKSRIVPAMKHKKTGKLLRGQRGEEHMDTYQRKFGPSLDAASKLEKDYDTGYYDSKRNKFHGRFVLGRPVDSPDLMTRTQRIRKYGTEEIEHEDEMILESGLVVARRYPDGKVKYGKPGQMHVHLVGGDKDDYEDRDLGFAEPGGKFLSRNQALSHVAKHEPKIRRQLQKGKEGGLESYVYSRAREGHSVAHFFPKRRGQIREDIKRSFLHKFKNKAREYAPHTGCSDQGSSAGACAVASHAVHTALKKKGKDSHFVIGSYDEKGKHNQKGWGDNHSWVVSGNKIIDVTHNQFGKVQRGEKTKRKPSWARPMTGPAIVKTQSNDPRYRESKRDDAAIKQVRKKWPTDQRPRPDF